MTLKDPEARRAYNREYMRRRHAADPEAKRLQIARVRRNNARYEIDKKAWVNGYLAEHPCVDCGEDDRVVMEFDHVRGEKRYNVSTLIYGGHSLAALKREVAKCEVRCANCHRRATWRRRGEAKEARAI